ncbi:LysR family transcriptional regulator [Castellaniella sp. GW247-6E4]|uniref:LysR family transcriptional regulator n=1 Tax=Castellaniella sp. GW247-6E4 TaxID=3140380 RepID=UPI003314BE9A
MTSKNASKDLTSSQPVQPTSRVRSRVTLAQIELMQQVARMHNITAAGREIGISGSLAARQIAALERALGVRLFQRTTRSIRLTEAGERVLEWASQTLEGFTALEDSMTTMTQTPRGMIRLAVNYYAAGTYLPRVLSEFCATYPEIKLSVITTDELIDLVTDTIDVAVHSGRIPDSSMVGIRVRSVHRVLCASPEYLRRKGTPKNLSDLNAHDCLVHSSNEPTNWFFRHGDNTVGITVRSRLEANNHNVLVEFARYGLGIARLGRNTVREDLKSGRLIQLLPDYACVYPSGELPNVWILYPNRKLLYRTRVLVDFLSEKLSALTEYPPGE